MAQDQERIRKLERDLASERHELGIREEELAELKSELSRAKSDKASFEREEREAEKAEHSRLLDHARQQVARCEGKIVECLNTIETVTREIAGMEATIEQLGRELDEARRK